MNARIRGIYSTALTSMLLDNGFKIVQPSLQTKERFRLQDATLENLLPDIDVYDRLDRQGVRVAGNAG